MKVFTGVSAAIVMTAAFLTGCSDYVERSELEKAYIEARSETKAAIEQTKDAIDSMKDNQEALEKVLSKLDTAMENISEEA